MIKWAYEREWTCGQGFCLPMRSRVGGTSPHRLRRTRGGTAWSAGRRGTGTGCKPPRILLRAFYARYSVHSGRRLDLSGYAAALLTGFCRRCFLGMRPWTRASRMLKEAGDRIDDADKDGNPTTAEVRAHRNLAEPIINCGTARRLKPLENAPVSIVQRAAVSSWERADS
jgi:hypothetical protein